MSNPLPPAPIDAPFGSYNWADWYEKVRRLINAVTIVTWSQISDFTGSNLNQLVTRSHQSLQNVKGTTVDNTAFGHVPVGGTSTQVLTKTSATDYDYAWAAGGSGGGTIVKGAAWDGAGFAIVAGTSLADVAVYCPDAKTISKVTVLTRGGTGSCVIDIWKAAYASYPPTVANTITAAAKPTITAATKYQDSALTGWTKSVSAGDVLMFHVDSTSTFTYLEIVLELT